MAAALVAEASAEVFMSAAIQCASCKKTPTPHDAAILVIEPVDRVPSDWWTVMHTPSKSGLQQQRHLCPECGNGKSLDEHLALVGFPPFLTVMPGGKK